MNRRTQQDNRQSNRQSMQIRERRTTMMSGKGIEDMIGELSNDGGEDWSESGSDEDPFSRLQKEHDKANNASTSQTDKVGASISMNQSNEKQSRQTMSKSVLINSGGESSLGTGVRRKASGGGVKFQEVYQEVVAEEEDGVPIISKHQDSDDEEITRMMTKNRKYQESGLTQIERTGESGRITIDRKIDKNYFSVLEAGGDIDNQLQQARNTTVNIYRKLSATQKNKTQKNDQPQFEDSDEKSSMPQDQNSSAILGSVMPQDNPLLRLSEPREKAEAANISSSLFQAQFVSPRDENAKKSLGLTTAQESMLDSNLNRPRNRTAGNRKYAQMQALKDLNGGDEEDDMLKQISTEEQLAAMMNDQEEDEDMGGDFMDRLLGEAEALHEERALEETSFSRANKSEASQSELQATGANQSQDSQKRSLGGQQM